MSEEQIQINPIKQKKLSEFIQNEIERSGFDADVMKYYGFELSPEDLSALKQLQKINQDIERWKQRGWLNKLWHHALGTFTFGLYSNDAPPPEIAEKEGGLLYKQLDIPVLNSLYKAFVSDYGLSPAGLAEGMGFAAQIPLGIRLLGLAGRGIKALGLLEKLGIDKVIEAEILNPVIRDGFYKWLYESNVNKFIWDSFRLGLLTAPWGGYGAVREMKWAGESPTLSDWIEGTARALPFTIVAAGPTMTLLERGIAKGLDRFRAWRLMDKRLGTLATEAERVVGEAIDGEAGRKAIKTIDEFIRDVNKDLHNRGFLEKISDFSPENIGSTQHNLGILRQSLETIEKTAPERIGLLYDTLDALKDIPYFQKIRGMLGDNFPRFMENVKRLKGFVEMMGDDLGLQYLFKNPEELLAIEDKIPELAPRLIKSVENADNVLRRELYGNFIPEIAERIFGKEGQAMPQWSFSALKNWLESMGLVHKTAKDFAIVSNATRQQLAYELFNRPELLEALSYVAPETMRNILRRRNEIFDKLVKIFDEELIPLWQKLPNDIKEILNTKAKIELLGGEEIGPKLKFNLDENLNIKNIEGVIKQSPQEIEKTLGQRISNVFDWSNMENIRKFVENEIRPRYGEALAQWEEIPEKTQEFLSSVQTLLRYGGVENIKEWLSKQPALDEIVDLAKKVDRMAVDPLGQDLIEFLGKYSFIGRKLAENREVRITNADKLGLLKGIFASGITDEERLLSFSYRIFDSREAQAFFVNQYVNSYINGTISEFLDRQYPIIYNFLKKSIPSLPKEYSIDNFVNAVRAIQDDALRMRIEATAKNGGIDPFVSRKEFLEQLFRVNQHDLVRTVEATKEAIREVAQEEAGGKLGTETIKKIPRAPSPQEIKTISETEKETIKLTKMPEKVRQRLEERVKDYKDFESFLNDKELTDKVLSFMTTARREKLLEQIERLEAQKEQEILDALLKENLSKYPVLNKIFSQSSKFRTSLEKAVNTLEKNKILENWWNMFSEEEERQINELMKRYNLYTSDLVTLNRKKFAEILSLSGDFYKMSDKWYKNKELESLKMNLLDEESKILENFYYNVKPIKVITRKDPSSISYAKKYGQPILVEGEPRIYTDGFILLADRNPNEVKKWYENLKKKSSMPEKTVSIEDVQQAYPEGESKEVKFIGFRQKSPGEIIAHLDAGLEESIPVHAEYYQWLKKEGYKIKSTGDPEVPLILERNGKDVGLLMPLGEDYREPIEKLKGQLEIKSESEIKEPSPMNLTVSPTFKVLEQFWGKDVNKVHNDLVSYLENTGFFEDTSKINLTELSKIMPSISKRILDSTSPPLTFRGKIFNVDTKRTFQEGGRTMVYLVSLTGEKETIPITKEFALWLKYTARTMENITGERPSIEEIIKSIKEPLITGQVEVSELDLYY